MPRPRVYVETTIPSAYFERRSTPAEVARREFTRKWWTQAKVGFDLVTSFAVVEELAAGPAQVREQWLSLARSLSILGIVPRILEVAQVYVAHKLMPSVPPTDAVHLAYASYYQCDYLVTWNCRHLANANKFGHIQRVNASLGLFVPRIATPQELLGGGHERP